MTKMEKSFNKVPNIARFYSKNKLYFAIAFFIILMILPYTVVKSSYALGVVTKILMYAIAASGLNLINGYSGQTNLATAYAAKEASATTKLASLIEAYNELE